MEVKQNINRHQSLDILIIKGCSNSPESLGTSWTCKPYCLLCQAKPAIITATWMSTTPASFSAIFSSPYSTSSFASVLAALDHNPQRLAYPASLAHNGTPHYLGSACVWTTTLMVGLRKIVATAVGEPLMSESEWARQRECFGHYPRGFLNVELRSTRDHDVICSGDGSSSDTNGRIAAAKSIGEALVGRVGNYLLIAQGHIIVCVSVEAVDSCHMWKKRRRATLTQASMKLPRVKGGPPLQLHIFSLSTSRVFQLIRKLGHKLDMQTILATVPGKSCHHHRHLDEHHSCLLLCHLCFTPQWLEQLVIPLFHFLICISVGHPGPQLPKVGISCKPCPQRHPSLLGKCLCVDDDSNGEAKEDCGYSSRGAVDVRVGVGKAAGVFWALPTRVSKFGKMWSFAAPEIMIGDGSSSDTNGRIAAAKSIGEALVGRVGNYMLIAQGHLNLLVSLSRLLIAATCGRREEEPH
ncbi:hypothetical protein Taro_049123 [Colocasia esculenta]|uniref:Uncharacterized protein n=1 Tax=Colocasia esculenta TaxID=4460 RepID=A0A843X9Y0_COLES|nr:hypothetical protein [Colocasia esculenta]